MQFFNFSCCLVLLCSFLSQGKRLADGRWPSALFQPESLRFDSSLTDLSARPAIVDGGSIPEGTLKLIIRTYIEDLVASTDVIDEIIKVKLLSLRWAAFSASRSETLFPGPSPFQTNKQTVLPNSDHIVSHPALHQNHFHVGSEPPTAEPASNHRLNEVGVCAFSGATRSIRSIRVPIKAPENLSISQTGEQKK